MLKEIIAFVIRYLCIPFLIRNIYARKKVTIVLYHDPTVEVLANHLNWISKKYNFITLDTLVEAIHSRDWTKIPPKSLIITIDDGYKKNYELLEVFKRFRIIPTIYLCSRIINTNRHLWMTERGRLDSEDLKKASNTERLKILKVNSNFELGKEYSEEERQALNAEEITSMKDFVDFQSHSLFHPILTTCSYNECKKEISQSKKDIEHFLGTECKHFSYPNGDYTKREIELLKKAGYLSGRTVDIGWNDLHTNPYTLKITGVSDEASLNLLIAELSGIMGYLSRLKSGSFNGKHPTIKKEELQ